MRVAAFLLALLLAAPLPGCGDDPATGRGGADDLAGPPRWRVAPEGPAREGTALTLWVRSPVRVRLRREGADLLPTSTPWRTLAAGRTIQVIYGAQQDPGADAPEQPGREDAAAGRTQRHVVLTSHQFADGIVHADRLLRFTRPAHGQLRIRKAVPPGRYEDVPTEGPIELLTVVIDDVAGGRVTVRRRGHATQVRPEAPLAPDDRLTTWRLFLDIERLTD